LGEILGNIHISHGIRGEIEGTREGIIGEQREKYGACGSDESEEHFFALAGRKHGLILRIRCFTKLFFGGTDAFLRYTALPGGLGGFCGYPGYLTAIPAFQAAFEFFEGGFFVLVLGTGCCGDHEYSSGEVTETHGGIRGVFFLSTRSGTSEKGEFQFIFGNRRHGPALRC